MLKESKTITPHESKAIISPDYVIDRSKLVITYVERMLRYGKEPNNSWKKYYRPRKVVYPIYTINKSSWRVKKWKKIDKRKRKYLYNKVRRAKWLHGVIVKHSVVL